METDKHLTGIIIFFSSLVIIILIGLLIKKENTQVKVKHIYHNTIIHSKPKPRDCVPSNGTNW
jgi:hypothetical protein